MNELALFAGAGGGILGGILNGWRTVCAVEINDYCRRVLMQRQDDGILEPFPIWNDITTFDGKPWTGCVDIVTGGFPCQDISAAGKGAGITGERSGLWSEMARVIGEVRPRYVLVENSPMLTLRGLGTVLGDLAAMGFYAEWGCISAAETGAPHKRERIWIVANASSGRCGKQDERQDQQQGRAEVVSASNMANANGAGCERQGQTQPTGWFCDAFLAGSGKDMANSNRLWESQPERSQQVADYADAVRNERRGFISAGESVPIERGIRADGLSGVCKEKREILANTHSHTAQWLESESQQSRHGRPSGLLGRAGIFHPWPADPADESESRVGRVSHGVAKRVDRLKALGNGQVPRVVAAAWETLSVD